MCLELKWVIIVEVYNHIHDDDEAKFGWKSFWNNLRWFILFFVWYFTYDQNHVAEKITIRRTNVYLGIK